MVGEEEGGMKGGWEREASWLSAELTTFFFLDMASRKCNGFGCF